MLSDPSFRLVFVLIINSLILSGFPFTSFHLAEASLSHFSWLYTHACAVVHKYHKMSCSQISRNINQTVLFAQHESLHKLWNNNRSMHVSQRKQNKNKTKLRHIQIDHAFYCSI